MTILWQRRLMAVAAMVAMAAGLAGCSGGSPDSGAAVAGNAADQARPVWADYVQCARSNGFPDWPDPVIDDRTGMATFPDVAGLNSKLATQQVQDVCGPILRRLPAQAVPKDQRPVTEEQLGNLRRYAECMRANGVPDWPDPNADGSWQLSQRLQDKNVIEPGDRACRHILSGGRTPNPSQTAKPE